MVIKRIVRETSLSAGDVSNALISLNNVVCDALKLQSPLHHLLPDDGYRSRSHRERRAEEPENHLHPQAEDV